MRRLSEGGKSHTRADRRERAEKEKIRRAKQEQAADQKELQREIYYLVQYLLKNDERQKTHSNTTSDTVDDKAA